MPKQKNLLDILVTKGLIEPGVLDKIKKEAERDNRNIEELLLERELVPEEKLYRLKGELLKVPFRYLAGYKPGADILKLVPLEAAQHYRFVPLNLDEKNMVLEVGMLNPEDIDTEEALKFIAHRHNLTPKSFVITLSDFRSIIREYSNLQGEIKQALSELRKELEKEEKKISKEEVEEKIEKIAEEAPISKVVALIIKHAIEQGASDIHIEPSEKSIRVRFRIDGILYTNLTLPIRIHPAIVSRIKILSHLKIDETRKPQDGRFFTQSGKKKIDFRVSTFPTYAGEKVVM